MMERTENKFLISVIIPAYNSEKYLADTLHSVLCQNFEQVEVVVVDDGSKDNTRQIVERLQKEDKRIRYFYQDNKGVSVARNLGLENAEGTFITFLDSDDALEPLFLETMYNYIHSVSGDLFYCGYYYRTQGTITGKVPENFETIGDPLVYVLKGEMLASISSLCIRRSFLQEIGLRFSQGCSYGEDMEFFYKLLYRIDPKRRIAIKAYLNNYNIRSNSLSQRENLWYSKVRCLWDINAKKRVYDYLCTHKHIDASLYITLAAERMKKTYLYYLWGTLLLGSKGDFCFLFHNYCIDRKSYPLDLPLKGIKIRIWEFCITTKFGQQIGRFIFRPYKYMQRLSVRMKQK